VNGAPVKTHHNETKGITMTTVEQWTAADIPNERGKKLADDLDRLQAVLVGGRWIEAAEARSPDTAASVDHYAGQLEFRAANEPHWYVVPMESVQAYRVFGETPTQGDDIRAWAKERGYPVSGSGRIPAAIVAEYESSH
jgi:Lsr2